MPAKPRLQQKNFKLDSDDVAAIRAWALGPGRKLPLPEQIKRLQAGIEGWFVNYQGVTDGTIRAALTGVSWASVQPDERRLAAWRERLERLREGRKGPLGL